MPQIIDANLGQAGVLRPRLHAGAQLLQRPAGDLAGEYVIGWLDALAPAGADLVEELQRGRGERKVVLPALLGGGRRLDPEPRLRVELRPGGEHGLARPAAGEHDQADAIGRRSAAIGVEPLDHAGELNAAQEPLPSLLWVARHALTGVALRLVAPGPVLPRHWLQGQRK